MSFSSSSIRSRFIVSLVGLVAGLGFIVSEVRSQDAAKSPAESSSELPTDSPALLAGIEAQRWQGNDLTRAIESLAKFQADRPEVERFFMRAMQSTNDALRYDAARWARSDRLYHQWKRLDALAVEPRRDIRRFHLLALAASRPPSDAVAVVTRLRRRLTGSADPSESGELDRALFDFASKRAVNTGFVAAWPAAGPRSRSGLLDDPPTVGSLRGWTDAVARFPGPRGRGPGEFRIGYRSTIDIEVGVHWRRGDTLVDLGDVRFKAMSDDVESYRIATIPISILTGDLPGSMIELHRAPGKRVDLRGIAFHSRKALAAAPTTRSIPLRVGAKVRDLVGFNPGRGDLVSDEDRDVGSFIVDLGPDAPTARSLWIDHWSPETAGSHYALFVNGKLVVELLSQSRPRPARVAKLAKDVLRPGANRFEFRRRRGGVVHVEMLRLHAGR